MQYAAAGYVGNFSTSSELANRYPPTIYAGRTATVSSDSSSVYMFCDGTQWYPVTTPANNIGNDYGGIVLEVGDSLTANGFIASNQSTTAQNWFGHALARAGMPAYKMVNGGVSGNTTAQILARLPALLTANNPTVVVFGPNSVNDLANNVTSDVTISNLRQAWTLARQYPTVKQVYITTVHPTNTQGLSTAAGGAGRRWYDAVNQYVKDFAKQNNCILLPAYDTFTAVDGGSIRTGYTVAAGDGVHWSYRGASEFATVIQNHVNVLTPRAWEMNRSSNNYKNLLGPCAVPQGSSASGSNGVGAGGGATITSAPFGTFARTLPGATSATGTVTSIASPVGLPSQATQIAATIAADGSAICVGWGHEQSSKNRYDNTLAATTYTYGERVSISSTLCAQVFSTSGTGTSAGSAAIFANSVAGDIVVDNAGGNQVVWLVTEKPLIGDKLLIEVDCSLDVITAGSGDVMVWARLTDSGGHAFDTYINYAGATTQSPWPTAVGSKRRMYRNVIDTTGIVDSGLNPLTDIRTLAVYAVAIGANGAQLTVQLHGASVSKVSS